MANFAKYASHSATDYRESIDFSVNPCENFYNFACGKWIQNHPIPGDSAHVSKNLLADTIVDERIKSRKLNSVSKNLFVNRWLVFHRSLQPNGN